jgi:hypothetical protein
MPRRASAVITLSGWVDEYADAVATIVLAPAL